MPFPDHSMLASAFVLAALFSDPAWAADGVVEINQTCATQTGCFSGDTPGYPVTIDGSVGRSYRLTSDLVIPDENTDGISISAPSTTVDLGGFEIVGAACEGVTSNCTPSSGSGVKLTNVITISGVAVHGGSITGMGWNGVYLGPQSEVRDLRVRWNRAHGISVVSGSTVSRNTAYQNGDDGIVVGSGSTVSDNTVYQNGLDGIFTGSESTISGNTVDGNARWGIVSDSGSVVSGNAASQNGDDGISVAAGSSVSGNTAYQNGGDGIHASVGSSVQRNTVRFNSGFGLNLMGAAYRENVITSNPAVPGSGTVTGGFDMGNNFCETSATCP